MHLHERITVNRPRSDVYAFWRNLTQLPLFMNHLVSVQGNPDGTTHWKAKSPIGTVDWDAEIVQDKPDEMISWRSVADSEVRNSGAVRFLDGDSGGTEVAVDISFDPPMGVLGEIVAKLFGEAPDQQIADDLKHFKEIMESGQAHVTRTFDRATTVETAERIAPGQKPLSPAAAAAKDELMASRDSTHAASTEPEYEGDVDVDRVAVKSAEGQVAARDMEAEGIAYPSTGRVGGILPDREDVVRSEVNPHVPKAVDPAIANDIDPSRRGLQTGKDQDKIDPNDRDAADRGTGAPI
jgi:Polyketide cyclase / dehydrase and lipid transport